MKTLTHKFVENIPNVIEEGILYVSIPYETAIHMCCCGCGNEVVTPISPTDWILTFNGESITLEPSIGNWSLDCRSHYYIRKNKIIWSGTYSIDEIKKVREVDLEDKLKYYNKSSSGKEYEPSDETRKQPTSIKKESFLDWFKSLLKIK